MMDRRGFLAGVAAVGVAGCASEKPLSVNPALPRGVVSRIGIASCTDETKPQPLWDTVLADKPDLFIFAGDNVYASPVPFDIRVLEKAYEVEAQVPQFARLRSTIPHLEIWDDHDFGKNDGGAEFEHKQATKDAFMKFWQVPADDPRRLHGGVYDAKVFGPPGQRVQVILMDVRWFRSRWKPTDQRDAPGKERYVPDADPRKTMLGQEQWRWLEEQLRVPADVRLLVSGIQVIVEGHGFERWGNFPLERQRLYDLVGRTRAEGLVVLSGDRHIGALYKQVQGTPYPLYEMTSSGVTHPWADAKEAGPNRLGELFTELHYGTVEIDWAARSLQLAIKDIKGAARRVQRVGFDELKVKA